MGNRNGTTQAKVYSSAGGVSWGEEKSTAADKRFSQHSVYAILVFKNPNDSNKGKIWVLGGNANGPKNDVWRSTNGQSWSQT